MKREKVLWMFNNERIRATDIRVEFHHAHLFIHFWTFYTPLTFLSMGGSLGDVSEEPDIGEAKEGLENELWCRWSDGKIELCSFTNLSITSPTLQLILQPFCHLTYVTAHSPTLLSLYLRHSSFSNPSVAPPTSQLILQLFFRFSYVTSSSPGEAARGIGTTIKNVVNTWKGSVLWSSVMNSCGLWLGYRRGARIAGNTWRETPNSKCIKSLFCCWE